MNRLRWQYRNLQRLYRKYIRQEASKRRLIDCVGPLWLLRHGVKVEERVRLWSGGEGWYNPDLCIPSKKLIVEADGWVHNKTKRRDYIRDHRLSELGWEVLRIEDWETRANPRGVRKRVRKFFKG